MSLIASVVTTFLYVIGLIKGVKDVLPEITVFATIMLTVVGLVYSIVMSLRSGEIFKRIKENFPKAKNGLYRGLIVSIAFCVVVVVESISILTIPVQNTIIKYVICFVCSYSFFMMLCATAHTFLSVASLLPLDDDLSD